MSEEDIDENLFLKSAHTTKECDHGESFAFCGMQGWRRSNEDCHKHLVPINDQLWKLWSYFTIFDGHNGIDTAQNASDLLDKNLINALNEMNGISNDQTIIHSSQLDYNQLKDLIQKTFLQLDDQLTGLVKDQSGSVCIASLIGPEDIYLINLGDSRAILISNNGEVLSFTKDHKPSSRKEEERIRKSGGRVTKHFNDVARVENVLAVSRALGDYSLDKHIIPASPDLIQFSKNSSSASYLILACDGIWDVMNNEEVAQFVSTRSSNTSLEDIASQLIDHSFQLGTMDNISCYIVKL